MRVVSVAIVYVRLLRNLYVSLPCD